MQPDTAAAAADLSIELPRLQHVLSGLIPHDLVSFLDVWGGNILALCALILISVLMTRACSRFTEVPGRLQNAVEAVVEAMENILKDILGSSMHEFLPFLGTLFLFIFIMNLTGLIPLLHSPTSQFEIALSLAIVVFCYVQMVAIRKLGLIGYIDHLMSSPRDLMGWLMAPLMLLLHLIAELVRPISLALRLFGNITGEDALIAAFTGLGVLALSGIGSPVGLPLGLPFIFLGMLFGLVQAFVFTILSAVYIAQVLPPEGESHAKNPIKS